MGKNDFLTPKAIANRIKAKGLQKLRWYCQMCQKQCRDENGFKCHCMSDSHQRMMKVFGDNPERFVDGYSEEFRESFLEMLRRSHNGTRVAATVVYNEFIADRHHVHMNSTIWTTLTEFVKYLGKEGIAEVDETPKGWFIKYTYKEPDVLLMESMRSKKKAAEKADEERLMQNVMMMAERAAAAAAQQQEQSGDKPECTELRRDGGKVAFQLAPTAPRVAAAGSSKFGGAAAASSRDNAEDGGVRKSGAGAVLASIFSGGAAGQADMEEGGEPAPKRAKADAGGRGGGTLEQLMKENEARKSHTSRKDYWLAEGIVVKVMSKSLKEQGLYKAKGVVIRVVDRYVGEIRLLDTSKVVRVDQAELETVIPQIGGAVRVLNGPYRDALGSLAAVDTARFKASVKIESGVYAGRVVGDLEYEDISKVHKEG
eukprot:jgi/Mesvir1/3825/Mv19793-RA.1